jgi:hypothetical protein
MMNPQARRALLEQALKAKTSERGDRFSDGSYLLSIKKIKLETSRKGEQLFIVDFRVDESSRISDKYAPNAVKSVVGWVQNFTTNADMAPGNTVSFLCALLDMKQPDEKTMTRDAYNEAFNNALEKMYVATDDDGAALKGARIRMTTFRTITKKGNDFLGCNWSHVPDQKDADVEANAATL